MDKYSGMNKVAVKQTRIHSAGKRPQKAKAWFFTAAPAAAAALYMLVRVLSENGGAVALLAGSIF